MGGAGGSAFGSPIGSPESLEHGPYQPPQPHILPTKSALRRSHRPTMDEFGTPTHPHPFPHGDPMSPPGVVPYGMPQNPYATPQNPYVYAGQQQPNGHPSHRHRMPSNDPTIMSIPMHSNRPSSNFPTPGGMRPMMTPGSMSGMPRSAGMHPGMMPTPGMPPGMMPTPGMPPGMHPGMMSGMPPGMMPTPGMSTPGMPPGMHPGMPPGMMPQPGMMPHLGDPMYQQTEGSQRRHKQQQRRRHRGDSSSSAESSDGVVPDPRYGGNANPLPQPPRVMPVPTAPPAVSPNGSILVDSPPATGRTVDAPPIPPKPPPNPLPVPPKAVIEDAEKNAALQAAAEEVKRAKERTERARDKAIARLEADTWAAAGIPVGINEDGEPHVPLIPGRTAPAAYSNVPKSKKKEEGVVYSNVKKRRGNEEDDDDEDEEEHHHALGGLTSLLKRMSTRHRADRPPPPVAPKPPKPARASKEVPHRAPTLPTYNSGNIPREEGIFPRGSGRGRSMSVSHLPSTNQYGPVVNGQQYAHPHQPGVQLPMQYDPHTQEYFDPSNGLWWNPNTRKYYNRRAANLATAAPKKGGKEKGGLMSMIKRWTTNTAPDAQPKPITAQLVLPTQPGATAGLKGVKAVGTVPPVRKSMQQQRINVYADHPQALGHDRSRSTSAVPSKRGTVPWGFPPGSMADNQQPGVLPNGWPSGVTPEAMAAASAPVSHIPQANVYFSRKNDVYGGFRLDSSHPISWGGVNAPTAEHWFESGRFENVGTGLGAEGMGTGWTFPSTLGLHANSGRKGGRFLKVLGKGTDEGLKKSRVEYARARTEESEFIMQLRTSRDIQVASTNAQLEGAERRDWPQVWRKKLEEILYLKFQQHPDLRELLLGTGTSRIIFNHEDSLLGDGGNVNGNSNNGENELGKALMRVRYTLSEQLAREEE